MVKNQGLNWVFYAKLILAIIVLYRVFMLDIYPVPTNDSFSYFRHAVSNKFLINPLAIIQPRGFKFSGYPLFVSIWHGASSFLPIDAMTLTVLVQRVLLAASLVCLIFAAGLITLPLVLFLSSAVFLAQSNLLLTEGLTMPLGIFFSIALVSIYALKDEDGILKSVRFWFLFLVMSISLIFLIITKVPHVVFGLPLVALAFNIGAAGGRFKFGFTKTAVPVILLMVLSFSYIAAISIDNKSQYGVLSPVMGKERMFYWASWNEVFVQRLENRKRPELSEFYDTGSPYGFMHSSERSCVHDFSCVGPIQDKRAREMLERAGLNLAKLKGVTLVKAIVGGGKVEIQGLRNVILKGNGPERTRRHLIKYKQDKKLKRFIKSYNRSEIPMVIGGLSKSEMSAGFYLIYQKLITVVAVLAFFLVIILRRIGLNTPYTYAFVSYLVFVSALANCLEDLWRFIIPCWTIAMVLIFFALAKSFDLPWRRELTNDS